MDGGTDTERCCVLTRLYWRRLPEGGDSSGKGPFATSLAEVSRNRRRSMITTRLGSDQFGSGQRLCGRRPVP